jgi:hypothetical protein
MKKQIGLLAVAGFFGLAAAANAQALAAPTSGAFDGTYHFVSSTKLNETYTTRGGSMGHCPERKPGPLHVVAGKAHYTTGSGRRIAAMVGPQGELEMKMSAPGTNTVEMHSAGGIDNTGTAHLRQRGNSCSYDFVWKK